MVVTASKLNLTFGALELFSETLLWMFVFTKDFLMSRQEKIWCCLFLGNWQTTLLKYCFVALWFGFIKNGQLLSATGIQHYTIYDINLWFYDGQRQVYVNWNCICLLRFQVFKKASNEALSSAVKWFFQSPTSPLKLSLNLKKMKRNHKVIKLSKKFYMTMNIPLHLVHALHCAGDIRGSQYLE